MSHASCFEDVLRMFTEFSFYKRGPIAQFTGGSVVFLLKTSCVYNGEWGTIKTNYRLGGRRSNNREVKASGARDLNAPPGACALAEGVMNARYLLE
ncbi:hypothetical protein EVAR_95709_1 [Eumeta japonica]|uniref:Uncharacterized protein n=1 Tax=Eumeta variegata TaxID=151549 RepID=A0A4C1VK24_EUMVA|nr:hypothetical protein EVAR_95709_1 [Eumeta japonica]